MWRANVGEGLLPAVQWVIEMDARGALDPAHLCRQASVVNSTNVPGESEYLFMPYTAFTVKRVEWSATAAEFEDGGKPHVIVLQPAVDSEREPEDLPLAPWC